MDIVKKENFYSEGVPLNQSPDKLRVTIDMPQRDYIRFRRLIKGSLQAENDRLKAELADSLPLEKVREMVEYCDAHRGDCENYDCYVSCPFQKLCEFLGDLTSCKDDDTVSILERYVKEVRGE